MSGALPGRAADRDEQRKRRQRSGEAAGMSRKAGMGMPVANRGVRRTQVEPSRKEVLMKGLRDQMETGF